MAYFEAYMANFGIIFFVELQNRSKNKSCVSFAYEVFTGNNWLFFEKQKYFTKFILEIITKFAFRANSEKSDQEQSELCDFVPNSQFPYTYTAFSHRHDTIFLAHFPIFISPVEFKKGRLHIHMPLIANCLFPIDVRIINSIQKCVWINLHKQFL